MITPSAKDRFEAVLKAEQLVDIPSSFREPSFCDEIPLYSRFKQVDFLRDYGDVDRQLLQLSLDYLNRIAAEQLETKPKRFVAITILRDDDNEPIVPHIFICNNNVRNQLKELHLSPALSTLGRYVQSLLRQNGHLGEYEVYDDGATVPDSVRVFIGYKTPPDRLVSLDDFSSNPSATVEKK
jgi:hypothetical protein